MAQTKTQLATRALSLVLKTNQPQGAEDLALVASIIDPLVAQLGIQGVTYVGDADEIDDAVFLPLARRLAAEISSDYGGEAPDEATIEDLNRPLRRMAASRPTYAPQKAKYF